MCEDHLRYVIEGPLWVSVLIYMPTTAVKWNIAELCGPFAELFFFLLKKDGKERPLLLQSGQVYGTTIGRLSGSTREY